MLLAFVAALLLFAAALFALVAALWVWRPLPAPSGQINVYYWTQNPQEADSAAALAYLQNTPANEGHYLLDDVALIPFDDPAALPGLLAAHAAAGGRTAVTTVGTEILATLFPFLEANPGFQLLDLYSTAAIPRPRNVLRFAINDDTTFSYALKKVPKGAVVYYDPLNEWAAAAGRYFGARGYETVAYQGEGPLPEGRPYLVAAIEQTPALLARVPASCPKLYGLDGSIFFPLEGALAAKAQAMALECISYAPEVTSPLIAEVEAAIGKQVSYIFPLGLDAIGYARSYLAGFSNQEIQETTSGFTGSLIFVDGDRAYGNLVWYVFAGGTGAAAWRLTEKIILESAGSCAIFPG